MVNLSRPLSGAIGPDCWFSDIFVSALQGHFTGGILIKAGSEDRVLFFREGDPVHARGLGFPNKYLGQVVGELGLLPTAAILEAIRFQEGLPPEERPLLGEVLQAKGGLSEEAVHRAVRHQTQARFASCFELEGASFQSAPGENEQVRRVGMKVDGWSVLLTGLTEHGAPAELRAIADKLLGKSARLKGSLRQLQALLTSLPPELEQGLRYLEKPRKPDQLERVLGRRRARGLLRLLELLELLEVGPPDRAVAIPKASPLKPQTAGSVTPPPATGRPSSADRGPSTPKAAAPAPEASAARAKAPLTSPPRRASGRDRALFDEIARFFASLSTLDHFAVLGVDRDDPPTLLRKKFTDLQKKFHPDAFSGRDVPPEVAEKVRAIAARINEAYHCLANIEARREYEESLATEDPRLGGHTQRREQKDDAAQKAQMAQVHLKKSEWDKARALLRQAFERDPHTKLYGGLLAWSMIADRSFDRRQALDEGLPLLLQAIESNDEHATLHFALGRAYKEKVDYDAALRHFERAAELDPSHYTGALSEIRLLRKRRQDKDPGMGGFFNGFLKRDPPNDKKKPSDKKRPNGKKPSGSSWLGTGPGSTKKAKGPTTGPGKKGPTTGPGKKGPKSGHGRKTDEDDGFFGLFRPKKS